MPDQHDFLTSTMEEKEGERVWAFECGDRLGGKEKEGKGGGEKKGHSMSFFPITAPVGGGGGRNEIHKKKDEWAQKAPAGEV